MVESVATSAKIVSDVTDVTKSEDTALNFLKTTKKQDLDWCLFQDDLVTISPDGKTVGEFVVNIKKVCNTKNPLLLVYASSQGKIDNIPIGTSLTTYLRPNDLSLVRQEHFEFVKVESQELQKKTEMIVDQRTGSLFVTRQIGQGRQCTKSVYVIPKEKMVGFLTEGTNLLLQRLFVRRGLHAEMEFVTLDSESGLLVQTTYKPMPVARQQIGGKQWKVNGIERSVISINKLPLTWRSYFLPDGHMTMRIQVGSPAVVTIEKVPAFASCQETDRNSIFQDASVENDNEKAQNDFLQKKEEIQSEHNRYLREHPEATVMLADYFQFLLLQQPENVVEFAADFFSTFSNCLPKISPSNTLQNQL